jgi:hypothetical protein
MCGGQSRRRYRIWAEMPPDPSPTPWDFNTWGHFCERCMRFFDLLEDGKVTTFQKDGEGYGVAWHKCGQQSRYITYDREKNT